MAERRRTFCIECRKETAYTLHKTAITKIIRKKEYQFLITTAHCKECGCEVGVNGILDYNAKEIDEQFRKAEGIISLEEIEKLGKIYNLGKAPLSIALGFGEVTIPRYLAGQIPSKEHSDLMRAALSDTGVMRRLLEENKDKLAESAYKKGMSAIEELNALFSVPSKMLMVVSYIFEQLGEVTPLALQKILYFIQGLYFSKYGIPLFNDNCQAWVHGPVYTDIYDMFRSFRYDPIDDPRFELLKGKSNGLNEKEREVIDLVINTFGLYGGKVLERITHKEDPWRNAREGYLENEPSQEEISKGAIKEYFASVREKYNLDTETGITNYIQNILAVP